MLCGFGPAGVLDAATMSSNRPSQHRQRQLLSVPILFYRHILRFDKYTLDMGSLPEPLDPQPPFELAGQSE
jgi:hypothetical protein